MGGGDWLNRLMIPDIEKIPKNAGF